MCNIALVPIVPQWQKLNLKLQGYLKQDQIIKFEILKPDHPHVEALPAKFFEFPPLASFKGKLLEEVRTAAVSRLDFTMNKVSVVDDVVSHGLKLGPNRFLVGVRAALANGLTSEAFGQKSWSIQWNSYDVARNHPITQVKLENETCDWWTGFDIIGANETKQMLNRAGADHRREHLPANTTIIGIFGEKFDTNDRAIKRFGFILL